MALGASPFSLSISKSINLMGIKLAMDVKHSIMVTLGINTSIMTS